MLLVADIMFRVLGADVAIVAGVVGLIYDSLGPSNKDASKGP